MVARVVLQFGHVHVYPPVHGLCCGCGAVPVSFVGVVPSALSYACRACGGQCARRHLVVHVQSVCGHPLVMGVLRRTGGDWIV